MSERPEIIIIRKSVLEGWLSDLSTFAVFAGLIGLGWFLDSSAMQWAGFFVAVVVLAGRALHGSKRLSIAEARERLEEIEARHD